MVFMYVLVAIRVATIFPPPSRPTLPHWVMERIPRCGVSRIIPGGNAEPGAFSQARFHPRYFYAVSETRARAFRRASQCHLKASCSALFPAAVSRLSHETDGTNPRALRSSLLFTIMHLPLYLPSITVDGISSRSITILASRNFIATLFRYYDVFLYSQ